MAKPIAGVNDYPYGKCGYIVGGALLKPNVRLSNVRIYKQRSIDIFDLLDQNTGEIYQKVQLTGYDVNKEPLDYSKSDDNLINVIPKNTFFVRGYDERKGINGFVIRFLTHKKVLSNGYTIYDMYIPTCEIDRNMGTVLIDTVIVNDTSISGVIINPTGSLNTNGMVATLTMPDGTEYTTNVVNGIFVFDNIVIDDTGFGSVTITSPNYDTKHVEFEIKPIGTDTDFVTVIPVLETELQDNGNGTYTASIPQSTHLRGVNLVIQLQLPPGHVIDSDVSVSSSGDISILLSEKIAFNTLIVGDTLLNKVYNSGIVWAKKGDVYEYNIPFSVHKKNEPSLTIYEGNREVLCEVQMDDSFNIKLISIDNFSGKIVIAGGL